MDAANAEAMNVWNRQLDAMRTARPPCKTEEEAEAGTCAGAEEQALQDALVHAQWLLSTLASQIAVTLAKMRASTYAFVEKVIPDSRTAMDKEARRLTSVLKEVDEQMEKDIAENSKSLRKERVELDDVADLLNDLKLQQSIQIAWREKTEVAIRQYLDGLKARNSAFREVSDQGFVLETEMRANLLLWSSLYDESSRKLAELNAEYQAYISGSTRSASKPAIVSKPSETDERDKTPFELLLQQTVNQEKSKKGGLRDQQLIIGTVMGPHPGIGAPDALLVYHDVGTGKTCTSYAVIRGYFDEGIRRRKPFDVVVGLPTEALRDKWMDDIDPSKPGKGCPYVLVKSVEKVNGPAGSGYLEVRLKSQSGVLGCTVWFIIYKKQIVTASAQKRADWGPSPGTADVVIVDEATNVVDPSNIPRGGGGQYTDYGKFAYDFGKRWVLADVPEAKSRKKGQKLLLLTGTPGSANNNSTTESEADEETELDLSLDDAKELSDLYRLLKAVKARTPSLATPELKPIASYFEKKTANGETYYVWKDKAGFLAATTKLVSYFSYLNVPKIYPHLTARCGTGTFASYPASDERDLGSACDYDFIPASDRIEELPEPFEPITSSEVKSRSEKDYGRWRPSYVYVPLEGTSSSKGRGGKGRKKASTTKKGSPTGANSFAGMDPAKPKSQNFNVNAGANQLNNKAKALATMIRWLNARDGANAGKHFVFTLGQSYYMAAGAIVYALTKFGPPGELFEFVPPREILQSMAAKGIRPLKSGEEIDSSRYASWADDWIASHQPKKRMVYLGEVKTGVYQTVYAPGEVDILKKGLQELFNHDANWNGAYVDVFVGSAKDAKEGLDLYDVTYEHFLDPPPNRNWYQQVQGRALRYMAHRQRNSRLHKDLPPDPEGTPYGGGPVEVFVYRWVRDNSEGDREVMLDLASSHPTRYEQALQALRSNAIDCPFHRNVTRVKCVGDSDEASGIPMPGDFANPLLPSDGFVRVDESGKVDPRGEIRVLTPEYNEREARIWIHLQTMGRQSQATNDWSADRVFDRFAYRGDPKEIDMNNWFYDDSLRRAPSNQTPGEVRERVMNLLRLPNAPEPLTQQKASKYVLTHVLAKGHPDWIAVLTKEDSFILNQVLQNRADARAKNNGGLALSLSEQEAVLRRLRIDALASFAQKAIPMLSSLSLQKIPTFFKPDGDILPYDDIRPTNASVQPSSINERGSSPDNTPTEEEEMDWNDQQTLPFSLDDEDFASKFADFKPTDFL